MALTGEWRKSSASGSADGGNCVEARRVCDSGNCVEIRNSKSASAGSVIFGDDEWLAFIDGAKRGEFDL